jgi:heme-degrading monooxygenase HmoA
MTFHPESTGQFLDVFNASSQLIRNSKGCRRLELLNDISERNVFFTYSFWDSQQDLDAYRNSELFNSVWKKTKVLFSAKAEAWSVEQKVVLE